MQRLVKTIALSAITFMLVCFGNFALANAVSDKGLSSNIQIMETNPKALFVGASEDGMQRHLLDQSAVKANIYSILYKDGFDYRYGLVGDVQVGELLLQSLAFQNNVQINNKDGGLDNLLKIIEAYVLNHNEEYSFAIESPIVKGIYVNSQKSNFVFNDKDKSYEGIISAQFYKNGVIYKDLVHVKLYNDSYYGPSVRFVLLKDKDNELLWPKTKILLAIK